MAGRRLAKDQKYRGVCVETDAHLHRRRLRRQSKTLDDGRTLHVSQYMGGVRVRAGRINTVAPGVRRVDPISVFVHALAGGTTRGAGDASTTGFMMGYGGG